MSFLYIQAHPGHFFSERVPQRTFTNSPVPTFSMERGYEHGCSPSGTACSAVPWNRHFEAVSLFGLSAFSFTDTTHFGRNAELQKCHGFVMALYKNHASDERKTLDSAAKPLGFPARFFFTRWMSGVRVPHRHHSVRTRTRFSMRRGLGTFFVYRRFCSESTQNSKQATAGYHHGGGALPFSHLGWSFG